MNEKNEKCVMVIEEDLPIGLAANTAAILGISLGKTQQHVVGADVKDKNGLLHSGVIEFPIPILRSHDEGIRKIRQRLSQPGFQEVIAADFSDLAQGCKTYAEYIETIAAAGEEDLHYFGIVLCGPAKKINKLTGNLSLYR